jgi:hypothetical protein
MKSGAGGLGGRRIGGNYLGKKLNVGSNKPYWCMTATWRLFQGQRSLEQGKDRPVGSRYCDALIWS